jgi:phosphoglycolate phosphatase
VTGAVLFDLDGTLADTPGAITAILTEVLRARGAEPGGAAIRATVGRPLEPVLAAFLGVPEGDPLAADAAADYQDRFRARLREDAGRLAYPGVAEGLRRLAAADLPLAVATSKPRGAAERILALMGIAGAFSTVAGHNCVRRGKPAPDMALLVAQRLGADPAECVVVGDGEADVRMALAAGMRAVGVSYGVAPADRLTAAGAYAVADSFPEAVGLLLAGAAADPPARTPAKEPS